MSKINGDEGREATVFSPTRIKKNQRSLLHSSEKFLGS